MLEFNKSHKYFKQLTMVCKCVAKDSARYALTHVEVNEKHIVATDGRRLACLDNFGIDRGRYAVMKCTKTLIVLVHVEAEGNFPKYEDIIPELPREDEKQIIRLIPSSLPNEQTAMLTTLAYDLAQHKTAVYLDYLKDFIECDSYYVIEPDHPVMFFGDCFVGIIVPVNMG